MGKFTLRPRSLRQWLSLRDYQRDRRRRKEDDDVVIPPPDPDPAAALPALSTDTAILLNSTASTSRYSFNTTIPAGDWTLGFWLKSNANGICFSLGPTSSIYTANGHLHVYAGNEVITATGKDAAGNALGVSGANPANSSSRGISSTINPPLGMPVFFVLRKSGSLIQMWLRFPGQAPIRAAEEFTTFGAIAAAGTYIGADRSSSFRWHGLLRKLFFVSYALTEAQIDAVARGSDPATFGTPAATDYHYPSNDNVATWTSTINALTATRFLTAGYGTGTGLGYAAISDSVFITAAQDGRVYQRESNGRATVPLSGLYIGADAPIQVLPIDFTTNVSVGNWTTVAPTPTGLTNFALKLFEV